MNINELMRLQHVNRWTLVATSRPQSVAEHSFNVSVLVQDVLNKANGNSEAVFNAQYAGVIALYHDANEAVWGDVPTPTKAAMKQAGFDFNEAMADPDEEAPPHGYGLVIKVMDIFESVYFLDNWGVGHRAEQVKTKLEYALAAKMKELYAYHPKLYTAAEETMDEAQGYE